MPNLLTFAEAMALDPSDVEWTKDTLESGKWSSLYLFQHLPLEYLRRCFFRRARVQEMAERGMAPGKSDVETIAIRAVCEYLRKVGAYYSSDSATADRIEREFLTR